MLFKKEKIIEKIGFIQIIYSFLLLFGIISPFCYVSIGTIHEFLYVTGLISTNISGKEEIDLVINSQIIEDSSYAIIVQVAGLIYTIFVFLIIITYIIYGILKRKTINKKGKESIMSMRRVGVILLISTVGLLILQISIFATHSISELLFPHAGFYIIIVSSLLILLVGFITYEKPEEEIQIGSPQEEISPYPEQSKSFQISPSSVIVAPKKKIDRRVIAYRTIMIVVSECVLIASGIGLVYVGIFIMKPWLPEELKFLFMLAWVIALTLNGIWLPAINFFEIKKGKKERYIAYRMFLVIVYDCILVALGIGLVYWGVFILETWIPADPELLIIVIFGGFLLPILAVLLIILGTGLPIVLSVYSFFKIFLK